MIEIFIINQKGDYVIIEQTFNTTLCIPDGVIDEFCYSFLKALFEKLKELEREDRIFKNGISEALSKEPIYSALTEIAVTVIDKLIHQINYFDVGHSSTPSIIKQMIDLAEEFLAIFEIK